jgi:hypothetical protein
MRWLRRFDAPERARSMAATASMVLVVPLMAPRGAWVCSLAGVSPWRRTTWPVRALATILAAQLVTVLGLRRWPKR